MPAVLEVDGSVDPRLLCRAAYGDSPFPRPAYATANDDECRQMAANRRSKLKVTDGGVPAVTDDVRRQRASDASPTQMPAEE